MSGNTLVVDTSLQSTQQANDFSVLGFDSVLPNSAIIPSVLTIDTFVNGVRPLLLNNPLVDLFEPGNAEKFLTNGTLTTDRATTGTFIDKTDGLLKTAAIDTIREEAEGFLIEGDSTNLLLRSEEFDNAAWGSIGSPTIDADVAVAPDGTNTMDRINFPVGDTSKVQTGAISGATAGRSFTFSIYLKEDSGTNNRIQLVETGGASGAALMQELNITESSTTTRFTVTGSVTVNDRTGVECRIRNSTGGESIFAWGAQLEELPFASSYIKTTTTAVTRAADNVSIPAAGNIPGPTEEYSVLAAVDILGIVGGASDEQLIFNVIGEDRRFMVVSRFGSGQDDAAIRHSDTSISPSGVDPTPGVIEKYAMTKDDTDLLMYKDSTQIVTSTPGSITGTKTQINIGRASSADSYLFGHILDFMIFERALTLLEIQTLESGADLPPSNSSDEDPLFPFVNALDFRDNTKYSAEATSGVVVLTFTQTQATDIDYFAFAIHNSQDAGLSGQLEVDSGFGFEVVVEFIGVPNNRPFLKFFGTKNSIQQRLTLTFTSKFFIGTIYIGKAIVFNRTPSLGFQPARFTSLDTVEQFRTDGNNFIIGRRETRGFQSKGTFRFVNFTDIEDFWVNFSNHVLDSKPVFFKWSNTKDQVVYGIQPVNRLHKPSYVTSNHSDITFEINGYA